MTYLIEDVDLGNDNYLEWDGTNYILTHDPGGGVDNTITLSQAALIEIILVRREVLADITEDAVVAYPETI